MRTLREYLKKAIIASNVHNVYIELSDNNDVLVKSVGMHEFIYLKDDRISHLEEANIVVIGNQVLQLEEETFSSSSSTIVTESLLGRRLYLDFYWQTLAEIF